MYSWGEMAKFGRLTAKPIVVVFKACRIKGVTLLRVTDAVKQVVIRVSRGKINAIILIAYRH